MKREVAKKEYQSVKECVVDDMKKLGTYKEGYDHIITIYADLLEQYQMAKTLFEEAGCQYETATAAGGTKKSAIVATLENLRKDILAYSDRLCLNPKSVETVTTENKSQSKLAEVLNSFGTF